jgi:hypothetical protein
MTLAWLGVILGLGVVYVLVESAMQRAFPPLVLGGSVPMLENRIPLPPFLDESSPGLPRGWRLNGTGAYRMDGLRLAPWSGPTLNLSPPLAAQVGELLLLVEVDFASIGTPAKGCNAVWLGGLRSLPTAAELVDRWYPLPDWSLERLAPSSVKP